MKDALGLIEVEGLTAAVTALDAACKNAQVELVGCEKVFDAGKSVSVTIQLAGQVAAVKSAVEAGTEAAKKVGTVLAVNVIPSPPEELEKLIRLFNEKYQKKLKEKKEAAEEKPEKRRNT